MDITLFQFANFALLLLLIILAVPVLTGLLLSPSSQPPAWKEAKREGRLSSSLRIAERTYGDKVRFYMWWMQIERLKREGVAGDFAELGVYRGKSARILHLIDSERVIHLFDTFEGFPACDLKGETGEASTYTTRHFADTGLSRMRRLGIAPDKMILYPGYFPDTAVGAANHLFALVNLDADLYRPTLSGLQFFYPRVLPGGVLFIHDYNNKWPGIIRAVDEFCRDIPEKPVLIPDRDGTVMILKS